MTTPAALVAEAERLGIQLQPDATGHALFALPPGRLPPGLKARLSQHKKEVIIYLRGVEAERKRSGSASAPAPIPCSSCGSVDWIASLVDDQGGRTCAACATGRTALVARGVPC